MNVTARELNRATLGRQLLLGREALGVDDAVRRVVALQAQQPASPYLALWNRLTAFDPADLDVALAGHTLVKATLMRLTLHVVHADDHPAMHTARARSSSSSSSARLAQLSVLMQQGSNARKQLINNSSETLGQRLVRKVTEA
jgi:hypothetical protein